MIPEGYQVVACPYCSGLGKYLTLRSGNTFGARSWTDGKRIAPMLPRPPEVVRCRHCATCYWLAGAREVGTAEYGAPEPGRPARKWEDVATVEEPSEDEYYAALDAGMASGPDQERNLRILAWHRRNDAYRDANPASSNVLSERAKANLVALIGLMNPTNDGQHVLKAEAFREIGEFDRARLELDSVTQPEIAGVARTLRGLCDAGDVTVHELKFGR